MKRLVTVLACMMVLLMVGNLLAAEKKAGGKKGRQAALQIPAWLKNVNLTDTQKEKVLAIVKEFAPERQEIAKKMSSILTDEQKKAAAAARKKAKEDGLTGKAAAEAVNAATKLTEQQKTDMAAVRKDMASFEKKLREKIMPVLTPEQQQQVKPAHGKKRNK